MRRALFLCLVLVFAAACGDSQEADQLAPTAEPAPTALACTDEEPKAPKKEDDLGTKKPEIKVPDGDPPCELVIQDIHEGDGAEAKAGATVTIHYVGVSWSTGEEFDSSWEAPEPATFPLGSLIPGWQEGIPGMKEGGRRRLIIPPELAYGEQGRPGIAPNETLIFVIDLIEADAD